MITAATVCRSSEITQQDGIKTRMAKRLFETNMTWLFPACLVVKFT